MVSNFKDKSAKAKKIGSGIFWSFVIAVLAYFAIDYGYDYFENEKYAGLNEGQKRNIQDMENRCTSDPNPENCLKVAKVMLEIMKAVGP